MDVAEPPEKCAACGKEGDSLKSCAACRMVKYCNVACQKAHRPNHKKECRKRSAELQEEELFREIPKQDCPVCFLPLPIEADQSSYQSCCGKVLCSGCIFGVIERAVAEENVELDICPFCRAPPPKSDQVILERLKKRMECGDGEAFCAMAGLYRDGSHSIPLDHSKALEMHLRAGELGCADGYFNAGNAVFQGRGVEVDVDIVKKAKEYYELAAKLGHADARHNLGCKEFNGRNTNRAIKHWMIAARAGHQSSLNAIKDFYKLGKASKDEFEKSLRAYQKSQDEMKSEMRSKAKRTK